MTATDVAVRDHDGAQLSAETVRGPLSSQRLAERATCEDPMGEITSLPSFMMVDRLPAAGGVLRAESPLGRSLRGWQEEAVYSTISCRTTFSFGMVDAWATERRETPRQPPKTSEFLTF